MRLNVHINGGEHTHEVSEGDNLARILVEKGYLGGVECGRGICRKCAVRLLKGSVAPASPGEDIHRGLPAGFVLACRSLVGEEDIDVEIAEGSTDTRRKARLPNLRAAMADGPGLSRKVFLKLNPPTLDDRTPDLERIIASLGEPLAVRRGVLAKLPAVLRNADFEITAVIIDNALADVEPGNTTEANYGFIADIGTTTIAIYLVSLNNGEIIDSEGLTNPQRGFGADVLSRIAACADGKAPDKLRELLLDGIGRTQRQLLDRNGIAEKNVYAMVVVGNTTMSHFFLGADPRNLAIAPFIPCFRSRVSLPGKDTPLPLHPEASIQVLANISGYVGSDTLGVAMATRPWESDEYALAVDIGTNGEILLGNRENMWACSTAAGPAFEGAHIECGMRAGDGAIEKVRIERDRIILGVIGNGEPKGICGSGLIDAVAELLRIGIIGPDGRFATEPEGLYANHLRTSRGGVREFVLAAGSAGGRDVVITQKDIRELQLAKAAIAAGIAILCKEAGISMGQVSRLFLAGAFGSYLDRQNAVALGMFPDIPVEKIIPAGNAAAYGAARSLVSITEMSLSDRIAARIKPVELSARQDFNDIWMHCLNFSAPGA